MVQAGYGTWRRKAGRRAAAASLACAVLVTSFASNQKLQEEGRLEKQSATSPVPEPLPFEVQRLPREQAVLLNAALPMAQGPLESAEPFRIGAELGDPMHTAAVECLAAAVYYEANSESVQGKKAVAQIVLNRVRHPAFPSSVCGVVYQGSDRQTGCQFTFTCDGSLTRRPSPIGWALATRLAREALAGEIERSVGMATHYHADYVLPYWAPDLAKIAVIGRHIFYRWSGYWGERRSFTQAYTGEAAPKLIAEGDLLDNEATSAPDHPLSPRGGERLLADSVGLSLKAEAEHLAAPEPPALRADETYGTLLADQKGPTLTSSPQRALMRSSNP